MVSKLNSVFKSKDGNRFINDSEGFDEEFMKKSDDASILYDNTQKLAKCFQNLAKETYLEEKKHTMAKCGVALRRFAGGMKHDKSGMMQSADEFDKLFKVTNAYGAEVYKNAVLKLNSFKDIDSKDIDNATQTVRKLQKDWFAKRKKQDDQMTQLAETAFKTAVPDVKEKMNKYVETGISMINAINTDMAAAHEKMCSDMSAL